MAEESSTLDSVLKGLLGFTGGVAQRNLVGSILMSGLRGGILGSRAGEAAPAEPGAWAPYLEALTGLGAGQGYAPAKAPPNTQALLSPGQNVLGSFSPGGMLEQMRQMQAMGAEVPAGSFTPAGSTMGSVHGMPVPKALDLGPYPPPMPGTKPKALPAQAAIDELLYGRVSPRMR